MILLLDNQDSFVHNLARYFRLTGAETRVIRSNQITAEEVFDLAPCAIVLSPGPLGPEEAGCSMDVVAKADAELPILGVCLGHQAIGAALGGKITQSAPRHGLASPLRHDDQGVFAGCPNPVEVARYHSLVVSEDGLPDDLIVTAKSLDDNCIMGLRHRVRPVFGVQFHPESVLSPCGQQIIHNFASLIRHRDP
ncbi:anthranilate synthase component II [Roseiconus lacunae]|uniref:Aminodeoxychorismate/anthranilate synthase component II n=1 Tax=Roseiconus lacunae TaxID=2605694 RepID=A0ABT7PHT7_9BACT|nr:aminodeoxychorismate/anthranilate synthase component II [Roseiconus lacunae]MDM4016057.1 aminodeoxychorismate/anthranilate synthase component II [Roseiconus lacunae]WRQ51609.1 aminodeoxychorismate/anthranilate synthase component II [Stieleria sp. HD01]